MTAQLRCSLSVVFIVASSAHALAQTPPAREVPARSIPVPETVSPQLQRIIGAPISPTWNVFPKTAAELRCPAPLRCRR